MFNENLKKLRIQYKLTQEELAQKIGIAKSTISMYENGKRQPNFETAEIIADFFNVNMDNLIRREEIEGLIDIPEATTGVMIPVLGYVRAGVPMTAVENIIDYEEISKEDAAKGEHFGLVVKGDSMEPRFAEGDVVIVRKQETVENGEIAVVLVNGDDATVKKFYRSDNGIKLVSTNPTYDPFFFTPDEVDSLPVQVIGRVVELRAKF